VEKRFLSLDMQNFHFKRVEQRHGQPLQARWEIRKSISPNNDIISLKFFK
jgi:hypothetical protein